MKPVIMYWLMILWAVVWLVFAPLQPVPRSVAVALMPILIICAFILGNRKFRLWWFQDVLRAIKKQKDSGEEITSYFILLIMIIYACDIQGPADFKTPWFHVHLWIYKSYQERTFNLLCVAVGLEHELVIKTIIINWELNEVRQ